jgi:hypothetical protein
VTIRQPSPSLTQPTTIRSSLPPLRLGIKAPAPRLTDPPSAAKHLPGGPARERQSAPDRLLGSSRGGPGRAYLLIGADSAEANDAMESRIAVCQLRLDECQVALSEVLAAAPRRARLLVPFEGTWNGQPVVVTGVLERTAVVQAAELPDDRVLARQADVLVHPGRLRWKEARPTRPGDGLVLQAQQRPKRCSDCRRTADETEFRAYKAAYCVECSRRRQAVIDRRRRAAAA